MEHLDEHHIVSGVMLHDGRLLILTRSEECFELKFMNEPPVTASDSTFFGTFVRESPVEGVRVKDIHKTCKCFFASVSLPGLQREATGGDDGDFQKRWMMLSDWHEWHAQGHHGLLLLSFAKCDSN